MKKILILLLGCELPKFQHEYEVCKETWLANTEKYSNIDYFIIRSSNENRIDIENKIIWVNCPDDVNHTFDKDRLAFNAIIDTNIYFDYIVRTNMSVYVNIDALNKYCQLIEDENFHCGDVCLFNNIYYPVGKIVIFNRKHIYTIINCPSSFTNEVDDYYFGKALQAFGISIFNGIYIWAPIDNHHLYKHVINNIDLYNVLFISVKVPDDSYEYFRDEEFHLRNIHNYIKDYNFTEENIYNIINCKKIIYDNLRHCTYSYDASNIKNR